MSYVPTVFSRRSRHHSHTGGYAPGYNAPGYGTQVNYVPQGNYGGEYGGDYGGNYGGQQYPLSRHYSHHGHGHRDHYPSSRVGQGYTTVAPAQYVTSSRSHHHYPSSHHSHSRHQNPVVINSGHHSSASYAHLPTSTSSSRYYAEGSGGRHVPVIAGRSYRDEQIPLSTRIRRLFGLGPKHSSGYHGKSVHIRRGNRGSYFTSRDSGRRRPSDATVFTI